MNRITQPRVSVVMATCGRARFLGPAIESVLGQSFHDLELIIADDGSDEATRESLRAWEKDPRVRVLWLTHRGIPGAVRNVALREARGRFVAFQDSDDVWMTDKLASQLAVLAATPGARWCYSACTHIDARGAPVAPTGIHPWSAHTGDIRDAVACLRAHAALPSVLLARDLLEQVGYFDEALRYFEDHDLWLRLASCAKVAVVASPLVQVRRHEQHYSGHDLLATAECRAIFLDRAWGSSISAPARAELHRIRALHSARLARLRALSGNTRAARQILRASLRAGWRYARWWVDAAHVYFSSAPLRFEARV